MGETAEFEKLNSLEMRLAAALDRIASGLAKTPPVAALEDPAITSAAFEDAVIRAQTAEGRIAALEAQLADVAARAASAAGDLETLTQERDRALADLRALEAARQSEREAATGTLATLEQELSRLQAALTEAQGAARLDPSLTEERDALQGRVAALGDQLAQAVADRDAAMRAAEEALAQSEAAPAQTDADPGALRNEIKDLQAINERLVKNINRLRGENATDPGVLNKTLVVELDALRALRASEAAELQRILAELDQAAAGEGADA